MCFKIYFTVLFFTVVCHNAHAQDSLKNRFSLGFGRINAWYYMEPSQNEIIQKIPHGGIYLKLDFMWKRVGFSTGVQFLQRSFYEKYPETNQANKLLGYQHASGVMAVPFYINYKVLDKRMFRVLVYAGTVYSSIKDEISPKYNYQPVPAYSAKPINHSNSFFSWSSGIDMEVNLYKRDIWLSMQCQYVTEAAHDQYNKRLLLNAGIKVDLSDILHKDAVKTLQMYPVRKA